MDKFNRSETVAAAAASEAIVTTVTMVTIISTTLRAPSNVPKPIMPVNAGYVVEDADDIHHGDVFVLSLYCNIHNMATVGRP